MRQNLRKNLPIKGGQGILEAPTNIVGQNDETAHIDIQPWGNENATHLTTADPGLFLAER